MCSRRSGSCARNAGRIRSITTIRSRPGRSSLTGACSMSRSRERRLLLSVGMMVAVSSFASAAEPGYYGYGTNATPEQIAGWDIDVRGDDGAGLPPGKGIVHRGEEVYAAQCALCHGAFGEGEGRFPKLAGGAVAPRGGRPPVRAGSCCALAATG